MFTRREFLITSTAAAASFALAQDSNSGTIRVGLIGCGGRGTGAAEDALQAAKMLKVNLEIVALADLFEDRLKGCRQYLAKHKDAVKVTDDTCFVGFDAYQKLLKTDVTYVILATPPGFRPIHFEAAIEAGKHVFMEKPVAVDPVGVRRVLEAGKRARMKNLGVVAGTQRRHQKSYLETIQRIKDGAIGEIVAARCYWNQGGLWARKREDGWTDMEWQCRNWLYFDWLSGDHIVEQHIHNIDVINWVVGGYPVKAVGVGGRQVRTDALYGNIYDHFAIDFEYANGVHLLSMCRQQPGTENASNVSEAVVGTKGIADPGGWIRGQEEWRFQGKQTNPYVQEHADLIQSIRDGKPLNEAEQVASSTLTAIMGREAAYTGKVITWDEIYNSNLDLSPAKHEFGPNPARPVPVPGKR